MTRTETIRGLIWFSDAAFQLAGILGVLAIFVGAFAEGRRQPSIAATYLSGVVCFFAAAALIAAFGAQQMFRRPTMEPN